MTIPLIRSLRIAASLTIAVVAVAYRHGATASGATEPDRPAWRAKFDEVYRLGDGEVVKLVSPPFIPEREQYYRREFAKDSDTRAEALAKWSFEFRWAKAGLQFRSLTAGEQTLAGAIALAGINPFDLEFKTGDGARYAPIPGDWIVREGAKPDDVLAAVLEILRERHQRHVRVERVGVEREVIVARGAYEFKPPAGAPEKADVRLFTGDPSDPRDERVGGGTGTLGDLLGAVERAAGMRVVDRCNAHLEKIGYAVHLSASEAAARDKVAALLENVAAQTSLTFQVEKRKMPVWRVTDTGEEPEGL